MSSCRIRLVKGVLKAIPKKGNMSLVSSNKIMYQSKVIIRICNYLHFTSCFRQTLEDSRDPLLKISCLYLASAKVMSSFFMEGHSTQQIVIKNINILYTGNQKMILVITPPSICFLLPKFLHLFPLCQLVRLINIAVLLSKLSKVWVHCFSVIYSMFTLPTTLTFQSFCK